MRPVHCWEKVPIIFSLAYAACLLDMNPESLRIMAHDGRFPAFKTGKNWKVEKAMLREWIEQQQVTSAQRQAM